MRSLLPIGASANSVRDASELSIVPPPADAKTCSKRSAGGRSIQPVVEQRDIEPRAIVRPEAGAVDAHLAHAAAEEVGAGRRGRIHRIGRSC